MNPEMAIRLLKYISFSVQLYIPTHFFVDYFTLKTMKMHGSENKKLRSKYCKIK